MRNREAISNINPPLNVVIELKNHSAIAAADISTSGIPPVLTPQKRHSMPSIEFFLRYLDQEYGEGKYTKYLSAFEKEDIDVRCLARLTEERLLRNYGVAEEGRRMNLIEFAQEVVNKGMPSL
jgi:hypothetical protein